MSADLLREAAALMRSRAEAATPGPWAEVGDGELMGCFAVVAGGEDEFNVAPAVIPVNAEHIASWHPAVALVVADWLDLEANLWEASSWYPDSGESMAVARAYLGRAS